MNYGQAYQTSGYSQYLQTSAYTTTPLTLLTSSTFNTSGSFNWTTILPSSIQMIWKNVFIRTYCKKTDVYNCNLKNNNNLTKL